MKRIIYIASLILAVCFQLKAQNASLVIKTGYGSYALTDIKANQEQTFNQLAFGLPAETISEFPPFSLMAWKASLR